MEFVNLTPHAINVENKNVTKTIPPSGDVLRIPMEKIQKKRVLNIPIFTQTPKQGEVVLPPKKNGVYYIVSSIVLAVIKEHYPERVDFVAPDTGAAKRNEKGHIVSVPGFVQ